MKKKRKGRPGDREVEEKGGGKKKKKRGEKVGENRREKSG